MLYVAFQYELRFQLLDRHDMVCTCAHFESACIAHTISMCSVLHGAVNTVYMLVEEVRLASFMR